VGIKIPSFSKLVSFRDAIKNKFTSPINSKTSTISSAHIVEHVEEVLKVGIIFLKVTHLHFLYEKDSSIDLMVIHILH
jgi:hypothetical protein